MPANAPPEPAADPTPATGAQEPAAAPEPAQAAETSGPEDAFSRAARARENGAAKSRAPNIKRKAKKIPVVMKLKAWFRAHPTAIYPGLTIFEDPTDEDEMESKPFYVMPDLEPDMFGIEGTYKATGYLICTASGAVKLFLVKEADDTGKIHPATDAKHEACADAQDSWTRMTWDGDSKAYDIHHADMAREPRWPEDISEETVLRLAFGKAFLDDMDHPLLQRLDSPA
jgi:hypothetical protein